LNAGGSHLFKSESKAQYTKCFKSWIPSGIQYQGEELKTVHGKTLIRLIVIHHSMCLDAKSQQHKVIDAVIEVAAYLYKNDILRFAQWLKVISMCLPPFSPSQPHSSTGLNPISSYLQQFGSEHIRMLGNIRMLGT